MKERFEQSSMPPSAPLPDFARMYEVPGQPAITPHAWERYQRDKKMYDVKIAEAAQRATEQQRLGLEAMVRNAAPLDQEKLVRVGLAATDLETQRIAASMISKVLIKDRAELIRAALALTDPEARLIAAETIDDAPKAKQLGLRKLLAKYIGAALATTDPTAQLLAAEAIWNAPQEEREKLKTLLLPHIYAGLQSTDSEMRRIAAEMIRCATDEERDKLILIGLQSTDPVVQRITARTIQHSSIGNLRRATLIRAGLVTTDLETQRLAAANIKHVSGNIQAELQTLLVEHINAALNTTDPEMQRFAARMIRYAPEEARARLHALAITVLGDRLVAPPLYQGRKLKGLLDRVKFTKTGSETTLVGGSLQEKSIIRHIAPNAFQSWQRLYENHELWRSNGFDYVPIEPIHAFRLTPDGQVDAWSGVLDLNLSAWRDIGGDFLSELGQDGDHIVGVLRTQGVQHGHPHAANFCLRFARNADGHVDFTKKPRIYLIDFDEAASQNPQ